MRKWFSFGIFKEGVRQLRLSGFSVIAVFTILNLLPPISIWSTNVSDWEPRFLEWGLYGVFPSIFAVAAPILLCSILFRFVMRRSDSDFYGALPFTRQSIFCSFTAAILAYVVSGVLLSVLLNIFLFWMMGCYIISFGEVILVLLTVITAAMLVAGALLVGIMLCGRLFNAFFTGGLLLCLPRAVATMFLYTCMSILNWQLAPEEILLPQVLQQNTFIKLLTSWAIDKADIFPWQSILYSFILALVYIALAGVLFYYRKTEIAGESVPRPWLQVVCRLGISLPLMLFFTMVILLGQSEEVMLFIIGILCLLVYYVYELLTTKSWRRLIPATGWLLASVGVCLVFSGAVVGYNRYHIGITPAKDEIAYISFTKVPSYIEERGYMTEKLAQVRFEETIVLQMVSTSVKQLMEDQSPLSHSYVGGQRVRTKIVLKNGKTYYRRLSLSEMEFEMILSANKTYKSILAGLPERQEFSKMTYGKTQTDDTAIYDIFYKEFMALPIERRIDLHSPEMIYSENGISVEIFYNTNGKKSGYRFCLTAKEFPQTLCELAKKQDTTVLRYRLEQAVRDNNQLSIYASFYRDALADGVFDKNASPQLLNKLLTCVAKPIDKTAAGYLHFIMDDGYEFCLLPLSEEDYDALRTMFYDAVDTSYEKTNWDA